MLTKYGSSPILIASLLLLMQCQSASPPNGYESFPLEDLQAFPIPDKIGTSAKRKQKKTGKNTTARPMDSLYTLSNFPPIPFPTENASLSYALQNQIKLMARRKQAQKQQIGNLSLSLDQLIRTSERLLYWQNGHTPTLNESFDAYKIKGKDGKGNVYFTGYYTPIIKVSSRYSKHYPYPIYTNPKKEDWSGQMPTRAQIDGNGVLKGLGLEIAYANKLVDIYYMQVQGSGIIEYPNGRQEYLSFAGTNRHKYKSIEQYIIRNKNIRLSDVSINGIKNYFRLFPEKEQYILFKNPSYVFFRKKRDRPHGAGHVPLTPDYSIAVDPKYIPLGSTLLAALPILDEEGAFSHHEYSILAAQDIGGAIRGSGHVDVYCGIGKKAQKKAMAFHHYGSLWLLLPKPYAQQNLEVVSLK